MSAENRRDAALLYAAQRIGQDPTVSPTRLYNELRAQGRAYRKQDFLRDIAGLRGTPQRVNPGAIKGGIISGIMRRRDVRALPPERKAALKKLAAGAVDATAETGDAPWEQLRVVTAPGGGMAVHVDVDWDDIEELPDEAVIPDSINLSTIHHDDIKTAWSIMDHIFGRLT